MDKAAKRLGNMKREEKVAVAIELTDACVHVCKAGIRAQYPGVSEAELYEKLRKRLEWQKRVYKQEV
ncbi:MAG: hypothetical protein R3319_02460 [Candidatus Bathyarchaeia archaeon]|nr:hypothetical protein [Candidatus Bathyarchaeia archaeon]